MLRRMGRAGVWRGAGQFVSFSMVLRRVHMCMCIAGRGRCGGTDRGVTGKQEHRKGAWFGLCHLFMTGKNEKLGAYCTHQTWSDTLSYHYCSPSLILF